MKISQKIYDLCLLLEDKKALDITVCDTSMLKNPVDFYVLATATSVAHAKAIADYISESVQKSNLFEVGQREGLLTSDWLVVDLIEGFVHIFTKEVREKYNLEKLVNEGNNIRDFDKLKKDFEKEKSQQERNALKSTSKVKEKIEKQQKDRLKNQQKEKIKEGKKATLKEKPKQNKNLK